MRATGGGGGSGGVDVAALQDALKQATLQKEQLTANAKRLITAHREILAERDHLRAAAASAMGLPRRRKTPAFATADCPAESIAPLKLGIGLFIRDAESPEEPNRARGKGG